MWSLIFAIFFMISSIFRNGFSVLLLGGLLVFRLPVFSSAICGGSSGGSVLTEDVFEIFELSVEATRISFSCSHASIVDG